ncbi:MAG TPA: pilus assembly protein N-terminal domain-containing protein [Vicinamibacterales bacterium]|jgi:pilus assembly protein CpaC|nr:pilus assembly protein N-terminal domain-containing protein [Vicinamibacterales bacterium]
MRAATLKAGFAAFIIVILVATPQAQQAQAAPQAPAFGASGATASPRDPGERPVDIDLLVGRSTVLNVGAPISRVSLTVPDVADAMVTAPGQLLIHGKSPGTISLFVWDKGGAIKTYEVNVRRDLTILKEQVKQLFPGEQITVAGSGKDVVLSGSVSSKYVMEKAAEVAGGFVEKKENVVNLLQQQEGVASNQVMLRVRFAEVSRSALQELGATWLLNQFKSDWTARATTEQFVAPDFDDSKPGRLTFSDYLNVFVFNSKHGVGAVIRALSSKGLFQSLAEPNLITVNGKEASFLAGGEYPYPVAQMGNGATAISIVFKEYGIRLHFTPTVLGGDLINLKVKPEVSSLDFTNSIVLDGFRLPALSTRRADTEVELQDGQTFAIAGLMNNTLNQTVQKIPGIGDIPVLGLLFKSRAYQKNDTELVVMVTPTIVRRGSTGVSPGLPSLVEPYLTRPEQTLPPPTPYIGSPRYPANTTAPKSSQQPAPAPEPQAQSAPVTRPIQGNATLTDADAPTLAAVPSKIPEKAAPAAPHKMMTKAEIKAQEKQREEQRKAAEAAAKRDAEAQKVAQKKAEEDRRVAEKLEKEHAEAARRKAEEDAKRDKAMNDAAARLKAAQAAYEAELAKGKKK